MGVDSKVVAGNTVILCKYLECYISASLSLRGRSLPEAIPW